jgi:Domain of unknown function (DUF3331)
MKMNCAEVQTDIPALAISQVRRSRPQATESREYASDKTRSHTRTGEGLKSPVQRTRSSTNTRPQLADPWAEVVSNLSESGRSQAHRRRHDVIASSSPYLGNKAQPAIAGKREHVHSQLSRNVHVSLVERLGAKSVSITWHDSTAACYGEQLWMRRVARSAGLCALTGMIVRRGDFVYGPASRAAVRPLNCTQMILATVLERLECQNAGG